MKTKFPKTTAIKLSNLQLPLSVFPGTSFLSNKKFESFHSDLRSYSLNSKNPINLLKIVKFNNGTDGFFNPIKKIADCLNENNHSINVSLSQHRLLFGGFLKAS